MAYAFASANSRYLSTASAPASGSPMTIAAWARPSGTAQGVIASVGVNGAVARNNLRLNATNNVGAFTTNSSNVTVSATGGVISASTWGHAAAVYASAASRIAYANGVAGTENTTSVDAGTGANAITIGAQWAVSVATYFSGDIAEVGVWNVALTAAEIASLAKGVTCDHVRPDNLVFYAPLIRDLIDKIGGLTVTNNNSATVATHTRVYA